MVEIYFQRTVQNQVSVSDNPRNVFFSCLVKGELCSAYIAVQKRGVRGRERTEANTSICSCTCHYYTCSIGPDLGTWSHIAARWLESVVHS